MSTSLGRGTIGSMILAGDVGGTKTHLGLFAIGGRRPDLLRSATYLTLDFPDLETMVGRFLADNGGASPEHAAFGVAGPVRSGRAELTNVPWTVNAESLEARFRFRSLKLLNDLQAMACAVAVLDSAEIRTLQEGQPAADGNMALIAAGTGLGEALLHKVGRRFVPSPSEGGHADFAPRTDRQIGLLAWLTARFGRAEYEHVISGPGLVNIFSFVHARQCEAGIMEETPDAPAAISGAALERRCASCAEALEIFVSVYGAEAGNLALRSMATAGLYVGGGIAPKILSALESGNFMAAFTDKGPMSELLAAMPVAVIVHPQVGLLGAAVAASL